MSRPCPLCGTPQKKILRAMRYTLFDDSSLPRATEIVRCLGCGFVYASSDAGPQDYLTHYQKNSIYSAPQKSRPATSHGPLTDRANRFLPHIPPHGTVVDIGAGSGDLLATVGLLRPDIHRIAIDPDPRCIDLLRAHGINAWQGTLDQLPAPLLQQADAAILSHVLEHLWLPAEGIGQAASLLRDNGVLYIETPDRLGYQENPNVPFYYFDPEHINHFSSSDLIHIGNPSSLHAVAYGRAILHLADGIPYPVCWSSLAKTHVATSTPEIAQGKETIEAYIQDEETRLQAWLAQAREILASAAHANEGIIVWGTGSQAQRMMAENLFTGMDVLALVDSDPSKQGRTIAGHRVRSPSQGLSVSQNALIVILAARAAAQSITQMLAHHHLDRKFVNLCPSV